MLVDTAKKNIIGLFPIKFIILRRSFETCFYMNTSFQTQELSLGNIATGAPQSV
jgi:hypothetical protein